MGGCLFWAAVLVALPLAVGYWLGELKRTRDVQKGEQREEHKS
ncbi:MAG: hypothetical protein N2447_09345 [Thermoanaerobaculum sp.]|nr:hypothetical protein [Thermoanaerobaculum sp.]